MSTAVQKFHEEEAIGKTYDWQVARRLLRYLKPYVRLLVPATVAVLISVFVWLPYLLLSKRVNVTYRHRVPA